MGVRINRTRHEGISIGNYYLYVSNAKTTARSSEDREDQGVAKVIIYIYTRIDGKLSLPTRYMLYIHDKIELPGEISIFVEDIRYGVFFRREISKKTRVWFDITAPPNTHIKRKKQILDLSN